MGGLSVNEARLITACIERVESRWRSSLRRRMSLATWTMFSVGLPARARSTSSCKDSWFDHRIDVISVSKPSALISSSSRTRFRPFRLSDSFRKHGMSFTTQRWQGVCSVHCQLGSIKLACSSPTAVHLLWPWLVDIPRRLSMHSSVADLGIWMRFLLSTLTPTYLNISAIKPGACPQTWLRL